jgi:hypothetical protein
VAQRSAKGMAPQRGGGSGSEGLLLLLHACLSGKQSRGIHQQQQILELSCAAVSSFQFVFNEQPKAIGTAVVRAAAECIPDQVQHRTTVLSTLATERRTPPTSVPSCTQCRLCATLCSCVLGALRWLHPQLEEAHPYHDGIMSGASMQHLSLSVSFSALPPLLSAPSGCAQFCAAVFGGLL